MPNTSASTSHQRMGTALQERQRQSKKSTEIRGLFDWTEPAEGVTRKLLIDKHGQAEWEEATMVKARDDGASEGWLKAGPAVGLSNFAALFEKTTQQEANSGELDVIKAGLEEADRKVSALEKDSESSECHIEALKRQFDATADSIIQATGKRRKAEADLLRATSELELIRRTDPEFKRRYQRAVRERTAANEQRLQAEQLKARAEEEAAAVLSAARAARENRLAAEQRLRKAAADVELAIAAADDMTSSASSWGAGSMPGAALRTARKAFLKACDAFDAVDINQTKLEHAEELLSHHGQQHVDKGPVPGDAAASASGGKSCSSEGFDRSKLEGICDEALRCIELHQQEATELLPSAVAASNVLVDESGKSFTEQLLLQKAKECQELRVSQADVAASIQRLPEVWDEVVSAQIAWSKASVLRRAPAQRIANAAKASTEATRRATAAESEYTAATSAIEGRKKMQIMLAKNTERIEAGGNAAEVEEAEWRQKRADLKPSLGTCYLQLLRLRVAQRRAVEGRAALHERCSEATELKKQVDMVKSAAVEALQAEEYDANQVEDAYHARKRQKVTPAMALSLPPGGCEAPAASAAPPEFTSLELA